MKKTLLIAAAAIIATLVILAVLSRFFVDWLWFDSLGYKSVFTTVWLTMIVMFIAVTVLSSALLWLNGFLAARAHTPGPRRRNSFRMMGRNIEGVPEIIEFSLDRIPWRLIVPAAALLIGLFIGFAQTSNWDTVLKWLHAVSFAKTEPLFGRDLGFYIFSLPAYELLISWATLIIFWSAVVSLAIYWVRGEIVYEQAGLPSLSPVAIRHLSALLAIYFLIKAAGYFIDRYDLLISNNGVVFGAGYTDVHLRVPLLIILAVAAVGAAALCVVNIFSAGIRLPIIAVALVFGLSLLTGVVPSLFQAYWVKPDEFRSSRVTSPTISPSPATVSRSIASRARRFQPKAN